MSGNSEAIAKAGKIIRVLERAGIPRDGVLFVHSAFGGFAREGHDPEVTVEALVNYMAPGTLLFPTMSWRFVTAARPQFDEVETPSNVGYLTEIFRKRHATRRSLHPTHSVAGRGALANEILASHHLDDTPCAKRSPFGLMTAHDGWVVMLGITMDCCTLVHHAEELVAPNLYLQPPEKAEAYTCRDRHGETVTVRLRRHLFLPRDYWQFQDRLTQSGKFRVDLVDSNVCRIFKARDMVDTCVAALRVQPDQVIAKPGGRYRLM